MSRILLAPLAVACALALASCDGGSDESIVKGHVGRHADSEVVSARLFRSTSTTDLTGCIVETQPLAADGDFLFKNVPIGEPMGVQIFAGSTPPRYSDEACAHFMLLGSGETVRIDFEPSGSSWRPGEPTWE